MAASFLSDVVYLPKTDINKLVYVSQKAKH